MNPTDLEGRTYGPTSWTVSAEAVADFRMLTGSPEGPDAPPGFASAGLFAVAPDLLAELYELSVVHGEQSFTWSGPIELGSTYQITGAVTRARERGGVHFVTFEIEANDVFTGKALFLVSGDSSAAGEAAEREEPASDFRGDPGDGQRGASRSDLIRYAAATRDWNPVHWDHDAAVEAGFPGVVVHGLLQAGWALAAVGDRKISGARFRFRNPLLPGSPVDVSSESDDNRSSVTLSDAASEYLTATIQHPNE